MKGTIIFFCNPDNMQAASVLRAATNIAQRLGYQCAAQYSNACSLDSKPGAALFIVAIGGDGTILKAVPLAVRWNLPILGINLGRVGFLSEIVPSDFELALLRYNENMLLYDTRMMLSCSVNGQPVDDCLNEVLLYKASFSGVTHISFMIDGMQAGSVSCDGMIVGTPTGATGYSISAGGPIVSPGLDALVITPVCPHSLLARPIVASPNATLAFQMLSEGCLYIDGQQSIGLQTDDLITIKLADTKIRFLRMAPHNIYTLIREKLS